MIDTILNLTRLNRPVGIYLLFWPCCWGLALAHAPFTLYIVFFLGAVLMRSAGCIINDFVDKDIDKQVQRTKNRPFTNPQINLKFAITVLGVLLFLSLCLLLFFLPFRCWMLGLIGSVMLCIYPFMKRITFFPQLFLGFTFNLGALMGYLAMEETLSSSALMIYVIGVLWTLGYDTIYGFQDIEDDLKIGVKSTSIYFRNNPRLFLSIVYGLMSLLIAYQIKPDFLSLLVYGGILSLIIKQIFFTDFTKPESCLINFKGNFWIGFFIFCLCYLNFS